MELVLSCAIMKFQKKFLKQILGIAMGTNLAPILGNIFMAMLEEELVIIFKNKVKWPILFKRFIDDGFGIINGNKKDVQMWIKEFNNLRENIFIDKMSFGNNVACMDL